MSKKLTHEEFIDNFKKMLNSNHIEILGKYNGNKTPIECRCIIHNHIWNVRPNNLLNGSNCKFCGVQNRRQKRSDTHEEFIEKFNKFENSKTIKILGIYDGCNKNIKCECLIHNYIFNPVAGSLLQGTGCKFCGFEKARNSTTKTHEKFIKDFENKNFNDIEIIGKYINSSTPIECKCRIDEYIWEARPSDLLNGSGCPKCYGRILQNTEIFVLSMKNINPNIKIIGEYVNSQTPIKCECLIDKYIWNPKPNSLSNGRGCPVCSNNLVLFGINSLQDSNPEIAKLLLNPEDGHKYTNGSRKKVDWKCPDCGNIIYKKEIGMIVNNKLYCPNCSDGISFSEKMMSDVLKQLNIDFEIQVKFNWSNRKKYDFYINKKSLIIETHGMQHYESQWGNSIEKEQENDRYKYDMAIKNGINKYIVIDCRYSELDYVKNSIINSELNNLFDLSIIDWEKCYKNSLKSKVIEACNLWNNETKSIKEISNILKLHVDTIRNYLKRGSQIQLCDYNPGKASIDNYNNIRIKVKCLNNNKIYNSIVEASKDSHISVCTIHKICNGEKIRQTKNEIYDNWEYVN